MENNNLIPVWDELADIKGVLKLKPKEETEKPVQPYDEIKLFEKAGKLKFKLYQKKYFLEFETVVPEDYPARKPTLKFVDHNYDPNFAKIFNAGAEQIIRRLWEGGYPGYEPGESGNINKGKIGTKKQQGALQSEMAKMKLLSRHELKHDIEFLNNANELRHEGTKEANKYMKLKMKHEAKYEEGMQKEEAEIQRIKDLNAGKLNEDTAEPSLYHVVNYLANYFVRFLPSAKCPHCHEPLVKKLKLSIKEDPFRPERSYCGHWMHYQCFEEFVNTPPFLRECPIEKCTAKFGSKNFLIDEGAVKSREKQYMKDEEQRGEEDDMYRVLGM